MGASIEYHIPELMLSCSLRSVNKLTAEQISTGFESQLPARNSHPPSGFEPMQDAKPRGVVAVRPAGEAIRKLCGTVSKNVAAAGVYDFGVGPHV